MKKKGEPAQPEIVKAKDIMTIVDENKPAMGVSHAIQDKILTDVARQMWEKEVEAKFKQKFSTKWSTQYGPKMVTVKPDDRIDDPVVTPKKKRTIHDLRSQELKRIQKKGSPPNILAIDMQAD